MKTVYLYLVCLLFCPVLAYAGTITKNDIHYKDGRYTSHTVALLDAPYDKVYSLLTDYAQLTKLNPTITESTVVRMEQGAQVVRTVTKDCVLFFCVEMKNTQKMQDNGNGRIAGTTIPAESNFKHGTMDWQIKKLSDTQTEVTMDGEFVPDFFIPPFVGPLIVKKRIQEQTAVSIRTVEKLAQ